MRLTNPWVMYVCKKLKLSGYTYFFLECHRSCIAAICVYNQCVVLAIGTCERWEKDWIGLDWTGAYISSEF